MCSALGCQVQFQSTRGGGLNALLVLSLGYPVSDCSSGQMLEETPSRVEAETKASVQGIDLGGDHVQQEEELAGGKQGSRKDGVSVWSSTGHRVPGACHLEDLLTRVGLCLQSICHRDKREKHLHHGEAPLPWVEGFPRCQLLHPIGLCTRG